MSEKCQQRKWDYKSRKEKAARRRLFNSNVMKVFSNRCCFANTRLSQPSLQYPFWHREQRMLHKCIAPSSNSPHYSFGHFLHAGRRFLRKSPQDTCHSARLPQ
jgi:hypothetical protein